MAELRYVDWDGLVYYDGKIKEFIRDKAEDYLKMGGILPIKDLPDPSWQNLNYIYKITDSFTSNDRFEKPGYIYPAGTWVQCVNFKEDERWLYVIFNEETIGGTADLSNYYTKDEIDDKIQEAIDSIESPDMSSFITRDEFETLTDEFATRSDIQYVDEAISEVGASVDNLSEIKADKSALVGLASEEFVLKKIAEAELADQDVDLSAYYTKSETEAKIKEAVDAVEIPDVSNFATKTELEEAINNIEHPSIDLSGYATKEELTVVQEQSARNEVKLLQVDSELFDIKKELEEIPTKYATKTELEDAINSIEHPTVDLTGYATEEFVNNAIANINIPEEQIYKVDFNAPDYVTAREAYNNGKVLVLTNAAPDVNSYAIMNYVSDKYITFTKFLMSRSEAYGAFNTYYLKSDNTWEVAKEVRLNKVEANVTEEATAELNKIRIGKEVYSLPDLTNYVQNTTLEETIQNISNTYVTNETLESANYVTEEYVQNQDFVTNEYIENNYTTTEQLEANYVTNTTLETTVENKVTEVIQEKVDAGEIEVKVDSITYGEF